MQQSRLSGVERKRIHLLLFAFRGFFETFERKFRDFCCCIMLQFSCKFPKFLSHTQIHCSPLSKINDKSVFENNFGRLNVYFYRSRLELRKTSSGNGSNITDE
jgi:hypothetical protein